MLEWLKRHAWKACIRQKRIGGSNPPLSATESCKSKDLQDSFIIILPCPSKITFTTYSVVLYIFYIISYKSSATICLWHIHSLIMYRKAMKKVLVVSFGRYDGVNIICVYYQTLANTRKEILLLLVKGFHKVVQLERHRHRLSVEEMHVTGVARNFCIGNVVRWHHS